MNQPQTAVVYHSRTEEARDEFIQDNPEAVLFFFGILALVAGIWILKNKR